MNDDKISYRRAEAAQYLNVSVRTIDQLKHNGDLPFCRLGRRLVLFLKKDLDALLQRRRIAAREDSQHVD